MISDPAHVPIFIAVAVVSVILNGIIVLADVALDFASPSKIREMLKGKEEKEILRVRKLLDRPSRYEFTNRMLCCVLTGVGVVSTIAVKSEPVGMMIVAVLIYLAFLVVFGEIFPSKIARQHSEKLTISFAGMQSFVCTIFLPLTALLIFIADLFLRLFRQETHIDENAFSEEDVMTMLERGQQDGAIKEEGKRMINSIFRFDDELAYEIMTPRTDVFLIDINDPQEEYMEQLMQMTYSRIPVCEGEPDNIIGILNIKDYLIRAREDGFENVPIREILRKPHFVPETKNIDSLFIEMQKEKQHISILIDEYGGFSGIVTVEDIIEEIVGDIDDEYDEEDEVIEKMGENCYLLDGNVSLDDLNETIGTNLESENSETIGGYLIDIIGEIPSDGYVNRTIEVDGYRFTILSVRERRIEKVRLDLPDGKPKEQEPVPAEKGGSGQEERPR